MPGAKCVVPVASQEGRAPERRGPMANGTGVNASSPPRPHGNSPSSVAWFIHPFIHSNPQLWSSRPGARDMAVKKTRGYVPRPQGASSQEDGSKEHKQARDIESQIK